MTEIKIVLNSIPPSQKNAKSIAYNRATGKPFIMSDKRVKDWQEGAEYELRKFKPKEPIEEHVQISAVFYFKDNRRRDLDNAITTIQDQLVRSGFIVDDSWKRLSIGSIRGELDKENPRSEITLKVL